MKRLGFLLLCVAAPLAAQDYRLRVDAGLGFNRGGSPIRLPQVTPLSFSAPPSAGEPYSGAHVGMTSPEAPNTGYHAS